MRKLSLLVACLAVRDRHWVRASIHPFQAGESRASLETLASFLLSHDPAVTFNPSATGVHCHNRPAVSRSSPTHMTEIQEMQEEKTATQAGALHKALSFSLLGASETPFDSFPRVFAEDLSYPWTHIPQSFLEELFKVIHPEFVVEVGCYVGGSSRRIAKAAVDTSTTDDLPCVLCIDTFLGDAQLWLEDDKQWLQLEHGFPRLYWQFLENVKEFRDVVVPFPCASLCALRVVQHLVLQQKVPAPTFIYLDTGHQKGETFHEIRQAFQLLAAGGIIVGDDLNWPAVETDVREFVETGEAVTGPDDEILSKLTGVTFNNDGGYWVLNEGSEAPQWILRKEYGELEDLFEHVYSEEPLTV